MSILEEEIEEASRGRIIPHEGEEKEKLRKKKSAETEKRFAKVNSDRKGTNLYDKDGSEIDYARGSAKETLSDKITPH